MINTKHLAELTERMVSIKEPKLMESFLKTILTPKELDEVASRLQILKMLKDGVPQRKIASTTILISCLHQPHLCGLHTIFPLHQIVIIIILNSVLNKNYQKRGVLGSSIALIETK